MSCGSGEQTRTRTCDQGCSNDDLLQTQNCNDVACPGKQKLIAKRQRDNLYIV